MPGGQRSQSGRPGGPWSISGVHLLCSATGAGGTRDTPPPARTNPSSLCSPHLPAGVCLDPGIWGKGHLGQEADWGGGEGARQRGHLLQLFLSSCPSSGPGAKGTSGLVRPAAAQSPGHRGDCPGRVPEPRAQAMQPLPSTPMHRLCGAPSPASVFQPSSHGLWFHCQGERRRQRAARAPWTWF